MSRAIRKSRIICLIKLGLKFELKQDWKTPLKSDSSKFTQPKMSQSRTYSLKSYTFRPHWKAYDSTII